MITMNLETEKRLIELQQQAEREDFAHHLAAARALARAGLSVAEIDGMTRGLFTRAEINALIAEANPPLPIIT